MGLSLADARALLSESRARFLSRVDVPAISGAMLVRYWPEISREDYDQLADLLNTYGSAANLSAQLTVSNPLADGKPVDGTWVHARVSQEWGDRDPQSPGIPPTINLYQVLVLSGSSGGTFTIEDNCRQSVTATVAYDQTSLPAVPSSGSGVSYVMRFELSRERGTYTTVLETTTRKYQNLEYDAKDSAAESEEARVQLGVVGQSVPTVADSDGVIVEQEQNPGPDCTKDVRTRTRTAKDQEGSGTEESGSESVSTELHTQNASEVSAQLADGTIQEALNEPTEFQGRQRTRVRTRTAKDQTSTSERETGDVSEAEELHTQNASEVSASSVAGQIQDAENLPTEFPGRKRTRLRTITAKDRESTNTQESGRESVSVTKHSQNASTVAAATVAGQIQEAANEPTEFPGRTRTALVTRTAKDQTGSATRETGDVSEVVAEHTQNTVEETAAEGAGVIQEARNEPTEFPGRKRTMLRTLTAKDREGSRTAESALESVSEETHSQNASEVVAAEVAGTVQDAVNDPTEFPGRARTLIRTRTAKDVETAQSTEHALESLAVEEHTAASTQVTAEEVAGEIQEAMNAPTEYLNRFRTALRIRTAKAYDSGWQDWTDADGTSAWRIFFNQATVPTDGVSSSYKVSVSPRYNDFGLFDGIMVRRPNTGGSSSSGDAFTTGTAEWTYTNEQGKIVQVGVKFTTSLSAAETFITATVQNGYTRRGSDGANRTGLTWLGRGRVAATRIWVQN